MPVHKTERYRLFLALVVYVAIITVTYREEMVGMLLAGVTAQLAVTTASLLDLFGLAAVTEGNLVVLASGTVFEVSYRCSGFLPITCLIVCILASYARPHAKCTGIVLGILVLLALNQVRVVHLILIHTHHPAWFQIAHNVLWGIAPVVAVLGMFAAWRVWLHQQAGREQRRHFSKISFSSSLPSSTCIRELKLRL